MPLSKYNGFVPGDTLPAENANSIDPDNIESPIANEAFRIIRADENGLLPVPLLNGLDGTDIGIFTITNVASANLKFNSSSTITVSGSSYTKYREITLNEDLPAVRISFAVACNSGEIYARLYKNGVAWGTERHITNATLTFDEDFTDLVSGDKIQLYARLVAGTGTTGLTGLYFDRNLTKINRSSLITPLPMTFGTDPTITL